MATKNAFIFMWDMYGIESIIPISKYEQIDRENIMRILKGENPERNPLDSIVSRCILRAKYNSQRHYEIYAIDCDPSLDQEFWIKQWQTEPQSTADLIRSRGHMLFSDRFQKKDIKII